MNGATWQIQNLNGIADLKINLEGPGVYVAKGPNGAGKSSAIEALKAASGDADAKAEPTDGIDKGQISGAGVVLAVGNRRRVNGAPAVQLVSTGAIGQLIDPGLKDSTLAAKARLRALLSLMPLPADDAAKMELTANDEELQLWIAGDPSRDAMDLAESVRRRANELANELEKKASQAEGEAASLHGLINELGQLDFEAGELFHVEREASQAQQEAAIATRTAEARIQLERQQEQIRQSVGQPPDVEALQAAFDQKTAAMLQAEADWKAAGEALRAGKLAALEYGKRAEILRRPVEGPTIEQAIELTARASALREKVESARKVETARQYMTKATAATEAATKAANRAKTLRAIAQGTAEALGRLLARRGLPGLLVQENRLAVQDGGTVKDFDTRLSFGQRVRVALGVALAGRNHGGDKLPILPLEPNFWLALDPEHKAEINKIAQERGVCLVTEEPGEGELRFERMNG